MTNVLKYGLFYLATLFVIKASANTADFTSTSECEGTQTFFVSTSVASSGSITQYRWDFDNDGFLMKLLGQQPLGFLIVQVLGWWVIRLLQAWGKRTKYIWKSS